MVFWKKCYDVVYRGEVLYLMYWCFVYVGEVLLNLGFFFGGIFIKIVLNFVIKFQSCLFYYQLIMIILDMFVCLFDDFEFGQRYFILFVGFFSC